MRGDDPGDGVLFNLEVWGVGQCSPLHSFRLHGRSQPVRLMAARMACKLVFVLVFWNKQIATHTNCFTWSSD